MTRGTTDRLDDILEAIAAARLGDERLSQAASIGDDVGLRVAFQSILHNLFVAVRGLRRRFDEDPAGR